MASGVLSASLALTDRNCPRDASDRLVWLTSMPRTDAMTLAVVDDDDDVRTALNRLLRAMGYRVVGFASAEDFEARSRRGGLRHHRHAPARGERPRAVRAAAPAAVAACPSSWSRATPTGSPATCPLPPIRRSSTSPSTRPRSRTRSPTRWRAWRPTVPTDDRYRRAAAAGGVGVWDWNLATGDIFVDPLLKELLGYQDHEIPNRVEDWGRLVHPDDAARVSERAQAHINGEAPAYEVEHRMLHRDGSIRWFLARGSVVRGPDGTAVSMAGTYTDITERRRSEEALRQAEEMNRRIVESSGDCVKILGLDGRLLYINPEGLRALELTDAGGLLNRPLAGFFDGDTRQAAEDAVGARARRRPRAVPVPDAHGDRRAEVVGRRGDADHRHGRHRRPAARGVARRHRAPPRGDAPRRAASGAGADRHRRSAAGRARQHRPPGRERGRRHGLHRPAARRRRRRPSATAPRPACRPAISRRCRA